MLMCPIFTNNWNESAKLNGYYHNAKLKLKDNCLHLQEQANIKVFAMDGKHSSLHRIPFHASQEKVLHNQLHWITDLTVRKNMAENMQTYCHHIE